jgi:phosphate transport system permease protein
MATFGLAFVVGRDWDPVRESFGALPVIYGTVASSLRPLHLAVPGSRGVAVYLAELAPAGVRRPLGFVVELLAAIPSVVYGLWGVFVLIPWLREDVQPALGATLGFLPLFDGPPRGFGMLAAGVVLAIMILPTIASVSRDVMRAVPVVFREGALALGATRFETVTAAVLPMARSGIVGAIILGLGRALGETMAVTMVIGNRHDVSASLFAPGYSMAAVIANEFADAAGGPIHESALIYMALLLFGVTVVVNAIARLLIWRVSRARKGACLRGARCDVASRVLWSS